ncbi:hypothetical protein CRYUN_Cryun29cG0021600 [Craigia yunnanensis]
MQKDQNIDEVKDKLKQTGIFKDEMPAFKRQLLLAANNAIAKNSARQVGFVSVGVESQADGGMKTTVNLENIVLLEEIESEDEERVEIEQRDVSSAVFGSLSRKREDGDNDEGGHDATTTKDNGGKSLLGALKRIERQKQA